MQGTKDKTVSLVLGSGGARGLAHVGVIRWLEENGYTIQSISGCSMGALVGGFYAAGKLDIYVNWLQKLDILSLIQVLDFHGSGGLISGESLMKKMDEMIGDPAIESLPLAFTAVTSDIDRGQEVWINSGSLLSAIRASISLPMFFTPYRYRGRLLVDGGVLNPVPIAPTFHDDTSQIIAVNLGGEVDPNLHTEASKHAERWYDKVRRYVADNILPDVWVTEAGFYQVADRSFDAMQGTIARMKLSAYPPDIEITIPRNICGTLEFDRVDEMIATGYHYCAKAFSNT
jgi:NTE family protein